MSSSFSTKKLDPRIETHETSLPFVDEDPIDTRYALAEFQLRQRPAQPGSDASPIIRFFFFFFFLIFIAVPSPLASSLASSSPPPTPTPFRLPRRRPGLPLLQPRGRRARLRRRRGDTAFRSPSLLGVGGPGGDAAGGLQEGQSRRGRKAGEGAPSVETFFSFFLFSRCFENGPGALRGRGGPRRGGRPEMGPGDFCGVPPSRGVHGMGLCGGRRIRRRRLSFLNFFLFFFFFFFFFFFVARPSLLGVCGNLRPRLPQARPFPGRRGRGRGSGLRGPRAGREGLLELRAGLFLFVFEGRRRKRGL